VNAVRGRDRKHDADQYFIERSLNRHRFTRLLTTSAHSSAASAKAGYSSGLNP
jgi:hypothetical protein